MDNKKSKKIVKEVETRLSKGKGIQMSWFGKIETFNIRRELESGRLKIFRHTTRGCDITSGDIIQNRNYIKEQAYLI